MAGSIVPTVIKHRAQGITRIKLAITVDASGDASVTTLPDCWGRLVAVGYKPGTLDTGADLTLKDLATGANILVLTNAGVTARWFRPTAVITDNVGVAVTAAASAVDVNRDIFLAGQLSLVVAQGGVSLAGELHLVVEDTLASRERGKA